ncbi:hypothetical protein S7711_03886 [Stachybotrys chartarum IBT 7711]|uniref:WH1 domain-containing protein n=1 Tax=Stachybotrys chartarum (strain CBS 109288 / IBT 7711) TaxID=1280523 RepID=A0A084AHW4_STACB|nr:hypothetical protein S7711_03886 [Stachybotrys chartarum IBT 7711]KFA51292.1 hypothetical protein S40293_04371 [Stachybotrys chartarum IBT 40293]KFA76508.1 hypothetical protein S40288_01571 [Stachybotrys chartarum IBT 40288]
MSRATPRKPRHTRQPSNRIPAISDYESDAVAMQPAYEPPPLRTNTELNLSVLQRYLPSISSILSIAANAVIYTFSHATQEWDKTGVEGTMFVSAQLPLPGEEQRPRACVFVLNRRGLDNVIVDLATVSHAVLDGELIIFKLEGQRGEEEKVLGVWIHNDRDDTRDANWTVIEESWRATRAAGTVEQPEAGPAMQAMGRTLTLSDLFARANGQGTAN